MEINGKGLLDASREGTLECVEALLQQGASVNYTDLSRVTPLHAAASGGHLEVVNKLLDAGADVNVTNRFRETPLHAAASGGHLEVVNKLLDAGADVNVTNRYIWTLLLAAASGGHLEVVNKLLDAGVDLNVRDEHKRTPLLLGASGGHVEVVNKLLDVGADLNVSDGYNRTPLHLAASGGHVEVVNKLLDAGADLNIRDWCNRTPLYLAAGGGHLEVVNKLLDAGADLNIRDGYIWTLLLAAASGGHLEVVNKLLDAGVDVNVRDEHKRTPLLLGASGGHVEVVNKLLDAGADLNVSDGYNRTPLYLAAGGGHVEVVNKLLDAGADLNIRDGYIWTLLLAAASGGHLEVVNKLLDAGVDLNVRDEYNRTPLHLAASGGHVEVVNKLLDAGADLNIRDRHKRTPLLLGASGGHVEVVNKLLDAGADLNVSGGYNRTPLHLAASGGHVEVVKKLLDAGADLNIRDGFQKNPLQLAVESGHLEVVKKALGTEAAVKVADSVPRMNDVFTARSAKDCQELLARFRQQSTLGPLPEVPYSLYILGRTSDEVINILRALPQDKNLEGLFVTNVIGELSLDKVFHWKYPSITKLTFINCGLQILPKDIDKHFPNVEELVLTNNDLRIIPDSVGNLSRLQVLRMSRNGLKVLPDTIGKLKNLKELYCVHNNLKTLPGTLSRLFDSLLRLDVKHNFISNLPTAITILLKRLLAFHCADNPLIKDLGSEKKNDIITYLEDLGNGTNNKLEVKLEVVGEEGVGKTTLVQALRTKWGIFKGSVKKTNGIEINQLQIEDVTFKVFDTAGDADFLETHLLFTSPNCLYLHVYNIATIGIDERGGIQLGRLEMWLKSIFVQAPGSRNVIVGTHADSRSHSREMNDVITHQIDSVLGKAQKAHSEQFQSNTVEDCYLCQGCPDAETLPSSIKEQSGKPCSSDTNLSEGNIPHVVGRHEVSSVKNYPAYFIDYIFGNRSIRKLKKLLVDKARKLLNDVPRTPRNWMDVLEVWRDTQGLPLLCKEEAQRIAVDCGITEHSTLCLMLSFFTNKGYIVYHDKVPDIIVLDPQWLADQLCRLISFKQDWIHDGLLKPEDLKKAFEGTDDRWQQEVIKLFRHFRICFPLCDGRELFPCRLPLGMPGHSLWPPIPDKEDRQVSYMCQFSFVPNSLFPEIVVAVNENPYVDKFPVPRFYRNRAIYQTREKHNGCQSCKDVPLRSCGKRHRVHLELSYPKNAVFVTVRGPRPCCIADSICEMIKTLAGKNTSMKIAPLCPKCFVENVGDVSRLKITSAHPTDHIACEIGHQVGQQSDVLRGELKIDLKPFESWDPCEDDDICPRLFVMLPINKETLSFLEYTLLKDGFAVHVLCEHPDQYHFLSSPGFRLPKPQRFVSMYGGRAYKLLEQMVNKKLSATVAGPASVQSFSGENIQVLRRFLRSSDEKFPEMKEKARVVSLKNPAKGEALKRSSLKKLLNISNDDDQVPFPGLTPVQVKNEILWLCPKHAEATSPKETAPNQDSFQDSEESQPNRAQEYAQAKEDTSGQEYSDNRVASYKELDGLSWQISPFWESLGRKLGVSQGIIDNLTYSLIYLQPHEKASQLLKAWYDDGGTDRQLAQALKNMGREDLAEQYCVKQEDLRETQWSAQQTQASSVSLLSEDKVKADISASDCNQEKYTSRTIQDATFFDCANQVKAAIGYINASNGVKATGFTISPRLVMSCQHVLRDCRDGDAAVHFNYSAPLTPKGHRKPVPLKSFRLQPDEFYYENVTLDYAVIAMGNSDGETEDGSDVAIISDVATEKRHLAGTNINIFSHPGGKPMMAAFRYNPAVAYPTDKRLVGKNLPSKEDIILHMADTDKGSSGAPMFNDSWLLVGIHQGFANEDPGDNSQRFFANYGRKITQILQDMFSQSGECLTEFEAQLKGKVSKLGLPFEDSKYTRNFREHCRDHN